MPLQEPKDLGAMYMRTVEFKVLLLTLKTPAEFFFIWSHDQNAIFVISMIHRSKVIKNKSKVDKSSTMLKLSFK